MGFNLCWIEEDRAKLERDVRCFNNLLAYLGTGSLFSTVNPS